ncbi:MAG: propionyl-CoA synthetase [Alphaproteobacteria bacterium]
MGIRDVWTRAKNEPEAFWSEAAQDIIWDTPFTTVCDTSKSPRTYWFTDGMLNSCYNAVDRHVDEGRGQQAAIIHDSPVTNSKRIVTYAELADEVARFAGVLASFGCSKGDRVIIYMPMIPQAIVATLACARLGVIHSIVFGGFAANELAVRIDDFSPKLIVAASCGIEPNRLVAYKPLLDEAIELATHKPQATIMYQRPQLHADMQDGRDHDWDAVMATAQAHGCVPVKATDPLYVLYTSGTTGQPKGIVRDNGGHAVALTWSMKHIYNVDTGDVFWAGSDIGWVVGHSYIIYGPLFRGCTSVLYEGKPVGTPDPGAFWRVISEHNVKSFFTAPTAIRAIRQQDPEANYLRHYDTSCLQALFVAGERCDPDTLHWSREQLKRPVIDHWWQTETGWSIAANCLGIELLPIKPGSPTLPVPGWDLVVLNEEGQECAPGEIGAICGKLPLPPSVFADVWNAPERYISSYFSRYPGTYETGDAGMIDEDGYVFVMARTDDVINVAGHRLSTGGMEEVLAEHPAVAECAVVGVADELKGQIPVGFVVISAGVNLAHDVIAKECVQLIRDKIGPVAAFKHVGIIPKLPKTRSGKILRATIQKMADGEAFRMPATIEDPDVLNDIETCLKQLGFAKGHST